MVKKDIMFNPLNKKISTILAFAIIFILGLILVGGILFYQSWWPEEKIEIFKKELKDETAGWKTYRNEEIDISFKYPKDWEDIILTKSGNDIENWPGTFFGGTFEPERLFSIGIFSKDYRWFEWAILNTKSVNVNWSPLEFAENMNINPDYVLFTKKLSEKSMLLASYDNAECSPHLFLSVLTPLNDTYPNFVIGISDSFWEKDSILDEQARIEIEETGVACDLLNGYKKIAQKIENSTYSDKLNSYIETVRLIADSLEK